MAEASPPCWGRSVVWHTSCEFKPPRYRWQHCSFNKHRDSRHRGQSLLRYPTDRLWYHYTKAVAKLRALHHFWVWLRVECSCSVDLWLLSTNRVKRLSSCRCTSCCNMQSNPEVMQVQASYFVTMVSFNCFPLLQQGPHSVRTTPVPRFLQKGNWSKFRQVLSLWFSDNFKRKRSGHTVICWWILVLQDNQVPVCPLCNIPIPVKRGEPPDIKVGQHIDTDCQSDPAKEKRKVSQAKLVFIGKINIKPMGPRETNQTNIDWKLFVPDLYQSLFTERLQNERSELSLMNFFQALHTFIEYSRLQVSFPQSKKGPLKEKIKTSCNLILMIYLLRISLVHPWHAHI